MFLSNKKAIHFSDESRIKYFEKFIPKNSLGKKIAYRFAFSLKAPKL